MKKIYITGLAGMLGCNLAFLLREYYHVYGVDIVEVNMPGIDSSVYDLLDEKLVREQLMIIRPDVVIHTVACVNVDLCEEQREFAKKLNAITTKVMAEVCNEVGAKLIYISTDAVFDPIDNQLSKESDEVNPKNEYARTKLMGERYALEYTDNLVLRTNIYGFNIQRKNSFGEWILSSLLNGETLTMFGDIYFSPILVNELALVIHQCINHGLCGLYHACGTGVVNKYEFAMTLKDEFKLTEGSVIQSTSDSHEFKAPRSKFMGMSNDKLRDELKLMIRTPKESIAYFRELYECNYHEDLKRFGGIKE